MSENIAVSLIVPVWNPGEGVKKCIESLRSQTLSNIEIIFVDDRGSDASMEAIRAAAELDSRIKILVNPENSGPGYSRNAGIEASRGEYLGFIDPDDYVAPDYLEKLYRAAREGNLDIAKGRIVYMKEDGTPAEHHEQNDVIRRGLKEGRPFYAIYTYEHHCAIYRREMLMRSGARYGLARRAQDTTFLLRACHAAKSLGLEDGAEYYFCERGNSAMHVFDMKSLGQRLFSFREQVDFMAEALKGDPWAPAYANGLFLSNLRFFACYESSPETDAALKSYAEDLREQLLRLPFAEDMKKTCYPVRALIDSRVILPSTPGYLPWQGASSGDWLKLLGLWTDFLGSHPEGVKSASYWINQIRSKAEEAGAKEGRGEEVKAEAAKILDSLPAAVRVQLFTAGAGSKAAKRLPAGLKKALLKLLGRS